jgi:4-hydroxybenzoyl-CoA reductase subunit beta
MDPFQTELPDTVDAAVAALAAHGSAGRVVKVIAGGTDAVPNMKHGLHEPDVVVHLGRIKSLRGVCALDGDDGGVIIGALTTLHDVSLNPMVQAVAPALSRAASLVAGPQLRRMGTLGGNIALDTRCLFYNQTHFWRESLGFCLKKDGSVCHVIAGGKKCVAAASNDTATILLCLDARVRLQTARGTRTMPLYDFYVADGIKNTILESDELITAVEVPAYRGPGRRLQGYAKLRHRNAIDYPLLSVGVVVDVDDKDVVTAARVVVSALQARPHKLPLDALIGRKFDDSFIEEVKKVGFAKCAPVKNIADDPAWRREMVPVMIARAFEDAGVAQ